MDGVLVDSNPYHLQKWTELLKEHHVPFEAAALPKQVLGPSNDITLRFFFGGQTTAEEIARLSEELEAKFRRVFGPHARPLPGLHSLLAECQANGVLMAVASAAMSKNLDFVVDALALRPYFRCLVSADEVSHSKPHPEIYLQTARKLGIEPAFCVAFEDSPVGIEAAKRAGMKCVAIASTFPLQELRQQTRADLVVPGFEGLTLHTLQGLFDRDASSPRNRA
jgi:HAD superfamily hydrolase (TIGR01509 family)